MARNKQRTYGRFRMIGRDASMNRRGNEKVFESDGVYLLKLVIAVLLATFWLKFRQPFMDFNGVPAGLLLGFVLVRQFEPLQQNRKILYAVLIIVTVICYFAPAGIVI